MLDLRRFRGHYKMSKAMAEVVALREAARGLPVVIVHPTTVLGPGDRRPTPTGTIVVHFLNGRMKAYTNLMQNLVDVRDVAAGHVLALEKGRPGERYVLGGENLAMSEIVRLLAEITGLPAPWFAIPHPLLHAMGRVNEWLSDHVTHREPLVPFEAKLHAVDSRPFDSSKARRELGFEAAARARGADRGGALVRERGLLPGRRRPRGSRTSRPSARPEPRPTSGEGRPLERSRSWAPAPPAQRSALLLARRGVGVVLVERHTDFAREFRGEGLLPGGVDALQQMGLGAALDALPQSRVDRIEVYQEPAPRARGGDLGEIAGALGRPALRLAARAARDARRRGVAPSGLPHRARLHRARPPARRPAGRRRARRHRRRARARSPPTT